MTRPGYNPRRKRESNPCLLLSRRTPCHLTSEEVFWIKMRQTRRVVATEFPPVSMLRIQVRETDVRQSLMHLCMIPSRFTFFTRHFHFHVLFSPLLSHRYFMLFLYIGLSYCSCSCGFNVLFFAELGLGHARGGSGPDETSSPPALESKEMYSWFLFPVCFLLCFSALRCSLSSLSFCLTGPFSWYFFHKPSSTRSRNVAASTVSKWSHTQKNLSHTLTHRLLAGNEETEERTLSLVLDKPQRQFEGVYGNASVRQTTRLGTLNTSIN